MTRQVFVSVQFMRDPRAAKQSRELTPEARREAFDSYYAYYGRFEVDVKEGFVTHHIQGSLLRYEVVTDLKRFFTLSGDRLDLSTPPTATRDQRTAGVSLALGAGTLMRASFTAAEARRSRLLKNAA